MKGRSRSEVRSGKKKEFEDRGEETQVRENERGAKTLAVCSG